MNDKLHKFLPSILVGIFFLALFLRLFKLDSMPFGFHNDEVDSGYEGLFILKNGHDTYARNWPIYFDKFGDFRPTGIFYLSGISGLIFGPSVFSTRLPSTIFGAATVIVLFFLYLEFFKGLPKRGAIMAAFLLSVLPWHIVLSRATQESIIGIFLITTGLFSLTRYFHLRKPKALVFACCLFFLSYFFYTGHRLLVPLILVAFCLEVVRLKGFAKNKAFMFIALGFLLLTIAILATPWGKGRFSQVVFYNNPATVNIASNLSFGDGPGHILIARIFHNKVVVTARALVSNYLTYFSGDFLFIKGGFPDRYVVPHAGLLYLTMIPFLVAGFVFLVSGFRKNNLLPIYLLFLSPMPVIFTYDDIPNMNRAAFMIIPLVMLTAYGFQKLWEGSNSTLWKILFAGLGFILVLESIYFGHQYLVHHNQYRSFRREDSVKELVLFVNENQNKYSKIVLPNEVNLPIYYWFFSNNFDKNLRIDLNQRPYKYTFENILFIREACPSKVRGELGDLKNSLVVDVGDCQLESGFREIARWVRKDATDAFKALEIE